MREESALGVWGVRGQDEVDAAHRCVHWERWQQGEDDSGGVVAVRESVWCMATLHDYDHAVYWRALAVHEAAHVVVGVAIGLPFLHVRLSSDRTALLGGSASFGGGDAQLHAVSLLAGGIGQAGWLDSRGYTSPELRRCASEISSIVDKRALIRIERDGFVVNWTRAASDAERVLAGSWDQVNTIAELLLTQRSLTPEQVLPALDTLDRVSVWRPDSATVALARAHPPDSLLQW